MSTATEGIEGFKDGEIPALTDASEFRDINLTTLRDVRGTDFQQDSHSIPTEKRERESLRRGALVNNDGTLTEVEEVQETAARSYNAFTTAVLPSGASYAGDPVQLVGADPRRSRVLISNNSDTQSIMVGPLEMIQSGAGFMLPPYNVFDPQVQGPIYACVPGGGVSAVSVGVWVEVNA